MIRNNINEIIAACRQVTAEYEALCGGFFGNPGKEGINRRIAFLEIIKELQNPNYTYTPEEAFMMLYQFYKKEKPSSRLVGLLQSELAQMLDIHIPPFMQSHPLVGSNGYEIGEAILQFEKEAEAMKQHMGMESDEDVMLVAINKR